MSRILNTTVVTCLFAVIACMHSPTGAENLTPAQKLVASPGVLVIAHRGNSSVAPENTLPAFQAALDAKADLIELDYFHAADGVPVVIHDEILDRTTNAEEVFGKPKLVVGDFPVAELQKLDVGAWFDEKYTGAKLPTLAESLKLIQSGSTTLIERKQGDAKTLVHMLETQKLIDQVVVQAFDFEFVANCRSLSSRLVLGAICGKPASEEQIRAAAATGADVIVWNHEKIGKEQIDEIHRLGKKAWAYTIDDPQRAAHLVAAGLDGVITNRPGTMKRLPQLSRP